MFNSLKPNILEKLFDRTFVPAIITFFVTLFLGLIFGLIFSPEDYQQGSTVRIMYVHVPSAWMAMAAYALMACFSFGYLVWRNPLAYYVARAAAPIGAIFTAICLITGSIWGFPTWGTWWVWDARLTSMLILLFLYLGYMALDDAFVDAEREAKSSSILAVIGAINLPIIKYSVEWWNTLHQPASIMRLDGPTIDGSMLLPLGLMAIAWMAFFYVVLGLRVRNILIQKKLDYLRS
jgi:heme exporter protein C